MIATITTRLCCRCPFTDFDKLLSMLRTLLFQYLQKLVEGVVRDFAPPEAFHTRKVQRFKAKYVKLGAEFIRKFPLPIKPLSCYLAVESCQSTGSTVPVTRTFDFTRKSLVQRSQRLQRLFEKLRGVYFSTCVAGEKCFVSIIKSCALTRLGFRLGIVNILARKVYPIVPAPVTFDGDRLDSAFDVPVFVEGKPCIYTVNFDTIFFKHIPGLCERHRGVFMARFDFRSTDFTVRDSRFAVFNILKKSVLGFAIPQYNVLDNLTRQVCPVRFRPFFEFRKMSFEFVCRYIFSKHTTIPTRQQHDMQMDLPHIINHVTEFNDVLLRLEFEPVGFSHGISHITPFNPLPVGWQTRHQAVTLVMFASVIVLIIPQFYYNCQVYF